MVGQNGRFGEEALGGGLDDFHLPCIIRSTLKRAIHCRRSPEQ